MSTSTVGSKEGALLATSCLVEARRRLGATASLSSIICLAERLEKAMRRVQPTDRAIAKRMEEVLSRIEEAGRGAFDAASGNSAQTDVMLGLLPPLKKPVQSVRRKDKTNVLFTA